MPEILTIECPFCKERVIKSMHSPETYGSHTVMVGSNRKTIPKLTPAKDEVLTQNCPNCGKSKKEIEYALKHGVPLSNNDVLKRLREAGIDPSKLK